MPLKAKGARLRVAVPGAISRQKGFDLLVACARHAERHELPLEFVVLGYTEQDAVLWESGRILITGPYRELGPDSLEKYWESMACDVALFISVTPETWCFTLSAAIAAGWPIVALDIGAIGERLRNSSGAHLLPWTSDASQINASLLKLQNGLSAV